MKESGVEREREREEKEEKEEKGEKGDRTKDSPKLGRQECSTQPRAGSQTTTEAGSSVLCIWDWETLTKDMK